MTGQVHLTVECDVESASAPSPGRMQPGKVMSLTGDADSAQRTPITKGCPALGSAVLVFEKALLKAEDPDDLVQATGATCSVLKKIVQKLLETNPRSSELVKAESLVDDILSSITWAILPELNECAPLLWDDSPTNALRSIKSIGLLHAASTSKIGLSPLSRERTEVVSSPDNASPGNLPPLTRVDQSKKGETALLDSPSHAGKGGGKSDKGDRFARQPERGSSEDLKSCELLSRRGSESTTIITPTVQGSFGRVGRIFRPEQEQSAASPSERFQSVKEASTWTTTTTMSCLQNNAENVNNRRGSRASGGQVMNTPTLPFGTPPAFGLSSQTSCAVPVPLSDSTCTIPNYPDRGDGILLATLAESTSIKEHPGPGLGLGIGNKVAKPSSRPVPVRFGDTSDTYVDCLIESQSISPKKAGRSLLDETPADNPMNTTDYLTRNEPTTPTTPRRLAKSASRQSSTGSCLNVPDGRHIQRASADSARVSVAFAGGIHPFGEALLPDPCCEGGFIRCPLDDVHKYVGLFILRHSGEVCMWNPKMVESTGIPETEACGNHVATFLLTSAEQQKVVELMHLALETGLTQQATVHLSCYDGANRCCVNMTLCPSLYPENEYLAAFCYERGSVEIRNDCVQWTVRSLKAHIAKLPKSPALNKVKETVDKLEKVTGRHAARSWGVVVLSNLLGKLKTHNLKSAKALGVDLIFSAVPEDIPTEVETDVQHMPLILGYLIHNALRHSKPGQQVIVSVSKMVETFVPFSQPGEARMSGSTSDGLRATTLLAFHVEDSGPGIAEDVLEKVKACVVDGGIEDVDGERGFGLVTTGLLIAECGGTLELLSSTDESDPVNSGTTAIVSIPLIVNTKDDITTQADTEMPAGGPGQGLKAMVIQPNAVTRSALCHYLWNKKYAVSVASVMDDAPDFSNIDVLITNTEDNDFTDDFFENIKTPHLHLVLTAYQPTADFKKLLSDNGVFLLPLPLQPLQVAQVLARVEESVSKAKAERDRIENIRRAFRVEETGSCPWERKRKLGTGAFGDVYEAIDRITKGTMAVKILRNPWNVIRYVCSLKVSTDPDNPTPVNYGTAKLLQVIVIFLQATVMVNPADRLPCTELSNQPFVSHLNGGGQRYRDLLRGCKRASLGGTANRATPARVTFGDKWGENNQQKDEEPREEVGKDDASDFSGWGSDGDDKVEEEQPHLHPGGDASTSGNKSRFARWRASFEGHPLPLENWQGLDS
eukprot:gene11701-18043_t